MHFTQRLAFCIPPNQNPSDSQWRSLQAVLYKADSCPALYKLDLFWQRGGRKAV